MNQDAKQAADIVYNGFPSRPDRFDNGILQIALAWLPYGGPDTDLVYDEFGISSQEFAQHVLDVLDRFDPPHLSTRTKLRLRTLAQSVLCGQATPSRRVVL